MRFETSWASRISSTMANCGGDSSDNASSDSADEKADSDDSNYPSLFPTNAKVVEAGRTDVALESASLSSDEVRLSDESSSSSKEVRRYSYPSLPTMAFPPSVACPTLPPAPAPSEESSASTVGFAPTYPAAPQVPFYSPIHVDLSQVPPGLNLPGYNTEPGASSVQPFYP
eukprot:283854_1